MDQSLDEADPEDYDALVLPGGVINADALRLQPKAVKFVKAFFDADKPVGRHAPGLIPPPPGPTRAGRGGNEGRRPAPQSSAP